MLHTKATCFAALRPLPYIPATEKGGKKEVKKKKKRASLSVKIHPILPQQNSKDMILMLVKNLKIILKLLHAELNPL